MMKIRDLGEDSLLPSSVTDNIKPKEQEFFTLGGIWSKWNDIFTFNIAVVEASHIMVENHNLFH